MAIANYEALNELLRDGDYNVRITVGHAGNQLYSAFLELIRDSLGRGILDSNEFMTFNIIGVYESGGIAGGTIECKGNELIISITSNSWLEDMVAIRFDKVTSTAKKKTWIIVR